jgi:hypothetical protein
MLLCRSFCQPDDSAVRYACARISIAHPPHGRRPAIGGPWGYCNFISIVIY